MAAPGRRPRESLHRCPSRRRPGHPGDLNKERAYWVDEDTIVWDADTAHDLRAVVLADRTLELTGDGGISGGDAIPLTLDGATRGRRRQVPHLAGLPDA